MAEEPHEEGSVHRAFAASFRRFLDATAAEALPFSRGMAGAPGPTEHRSVMGLSLSDLVSPSSVGMQAPEGPVE